MYNAIVHISFHDKNRSPWLLIFFSNIVKSPVEAVVGHLDSVPRVLSED